MIQEKQKFMAVLRINTDVSNEQIKRIVRDLGFTETTASKGNVKVYTFDSNPVDFFSMKEKLDSVKYSDLFTLIDIGLAPEFELIPVVEPPDISKIYWSILEWLDKGISDIAQEIGWILGEQSLAFDGAKTISSKSLNSKEFNLPLIIDKNNYKLIISLVNKENNEWKFSLKNAETGGKIPPNFKLRLLDENGKSFENNEAEAMEEETEIYIKVKLEAGEGLIWEVEPKSDNYYRQAIYF